MVWLLVAAARAQDVCPVGCPHAELQSAVDAVPPGAFGLITVEPGLWPGGVRIDGGRSIFLTASGFDPVTLSAEAPEEAVLTVEGATVDLLGIAIDARSTRAIDALDADVSTSLTTFVGSGLVSSDGGLVRLVRSTFTASLAVFSGSHAIGDGGVIAAYDSDVTLSASAIVGGTGGYGGGLFASATEPGHHVDLDAVEILDCRAIADGGQIYVEGPVALDILGAILTGGTASNGGILGLGDGGPTAVVSYTDLTDGYAVLNGGAALIRSGTFTFASGAFRESRAVYGGGLALEERPGPPPTLTMSNALVIGNLAILEGGGIYAPTGAIDLQDVTIGANGASDPGDPLDPDDHPGGGGLRITGDASIEAVRLTLCENSALNGGGALLDTDRPLAWTNLRVIENNALEDGGGLVVRGTGGLDLRFSSLLGNSSQFGRGAALSIYDHLAFDATLVGWSVGGIAVYVDGAATLDVGPSTAWWENARGDLAGLEPDGPLSTDPLIRYDVGTGCNAQQDWHSWYSPLRDAGPADRLDPDGTTSDIGTYGGPNGDPLLWTIDADADGFPVIYDCNEDDALVNPEAVEGYDGIDSNCDFHDDYDQDQDGHRHADWGGDDCDDADAGVYPGAPETAGLGVDQNCDGVLDADLDQYVFSEDCDDADPDVHPGAVDDDPTRDIDCDGFFDEPRPLVPRGCSTTGGGVGTGLVALVALTAGRRARGASRRGR